MSAPNNRIRVLELTATLAIGGSEQLAATIGRGLERSRFDVSFAAVGPDGPIGDRLRKEGFDALAFDRPAGITPKVSWMIWRYLRRLKIDVMQSHHLVSLVYGGLPARAAGVKVIHTEHDAQTFTQKPRYIGILRRLAPLVHTFVAIDPHLADFMHERVGIRREKIVVIRNGVDLSRFQARSGNSPAGNGPFRIGWVGRLEPPKRPDVLVDGFLRFAERHPDVELIVIGPGSLLEPSRQRANQSPLGSTVSFLGARHDIAQLLAGLDCFVLCSDNEGLPISLVEAMASGLPCVASAVGGIPALLHDGSTGLLLKQNEPGQLAESLERLHSSLEFRAELGRNARQAAVENYDLARMIGEYDRLFSTLAGRRGTV